MTKASDGEELLKKIDIVDVNLIFLKIINFVGREVLLAWLL